MQQTNGIAILLMGGSGRRMGNICGDKTLALIGGIPVFLHSILPIDSSGIFREIVIVTRDMAQQKTIESHVENLSMHADMDYVRGGDSRQNSVLNALLHLRQKPPEFVLIHDAARPLITLNNLKRLLSALKTSDGAVLARRATDTLVTVTDRGRTYLDRDAIWHIETPQIFRYEIILDAYLRAKTPLTDDSSALPANGKVAIIENIHPNIKITNPNDIAIAKALLSEDRSNGKFRIGNGYDVHRLVPGRDLILGGVRIEWDLGLLGHSDADVVIHALSDAILGALALPDIGVFFQDTDPNNRDLNSREILLFAKNKLRKQNFEISNLDITILAEGPKLAPFIGAMRNSIGEMLNIQPSQIGIKATTNEGLDAIGKKEAIAALATVLLIPCMD